VFIPAWCETVAERLPEPVAHEVETHSPGEVVLVVDDEPLLRSSMRMVLEHHGYRVLTAGNGQEALSALAQHGNGIRVVITDLVMPETDGLQLIETIRRRYPATRVIVSSGFPPTREMMARLGPSVATLAKPFDVRLLVHTLQDSFQAAAAVAESVARAA
jgi:DNA-binding NtrC family response regulator